MFMDGFRLDTPIYTRFPPTIPLVVHLDIEALIAWKCNTYDLKLGTAYTQLANLNMNCYSTNG